MFIRSCFIRFLLRKAQIFIQCSGKKLSVNASSSRNRNVGSTTADKRKHFIVTWAALEVIFVCAIIRSVCLQVNHQGKVFRAHWMLTLSLSLSLLVLLPR